MPRPRASRRACRHRTRLPLMQFRARPRKHSADFAGGGLRSSAVRVRRELMHTSFRSCKAAARHRRHRGRRLAAGHLPEAVWAPHSQSLRGHGQGCEIDAIGQIAVHTAGHEQAMDDVLTQIERENVSNGKPGRSLPRENAGADRPTPPPKKFEYRSQLPLPVLHRSRGQADLKPASRLQPLHDLMHAGAVA